MEKIAENAGARLWRGFVTFGSASAGVLAIFILVRLIKLIVDTIIHGYALHSVYGWSLHLLGAIWSSVTHLLLHLAGPRRENDARKQDEEAFIPPTIGPPSQPHSASEARTRTPTAPMPSESASENIKPIYYKELRAMLTNKEND